jgi:DNA-binding ferritin-like protein
MSTQTAKAPARAMSANAEVAQFLGEVFSFNTSLKLTHWGITGKGSYAAHLSLDEAITTLLDATDSLVETTIATLGDLNITVPETERPTDYIKHIEGFYEYVDAKRPIFPDTFTQSVLDNYQQGVKQLLYRLKRLQ